MKSVLSIQSHVVHGYVGNKAAVFPLQSQGWEVDNINTVSFSNHTGYGSFKGNIIDGDEELQPILSQLNEVLNLKYQAIITGYIPNSKIISIIHEGVKNFKKNNPDLIYLLDPVMGDNNYLYVDESCIDEYKRILQQKLVDIITPNQFEVELLVGFKITNEETLKKAIDFLHSEYSIRFVCITSLNSSFFQDTQHIYCAISTISKPDIKIFKIPNIKSYFTGVGDLFSALLLDKLTANLLASTDDLETFEKSVNQVLTIMSWTLQLTHKLALQQYNQHSTSSKPLEGKINDLDTMKYFELRIIQSRKFFSFDGTGDFKSTNLK